MVAIPLKQRSEAWHEYRRTRISATDIGIILGLNPYRCEADLADEKLGGERQPETLPMKVGTALEDVIAGEYMAQTGKRLLRFRSLVQHKTIPWAVASPDRRVKGAIGGHVVELKWTQSRSRFADGLPDDVQAQVQWQLGVLGWPAGDVAVLIGANDFEIFPVTADPDLFDDLVTTANNFRHRLAGGGPFSRDAARIRRDYPADDGSELEADSELSEAVLELLRLRASRDVIQATEAKLEDAIKAKMADHARLIGPGFTVTWKRTKDITSTDWKALAADLLGDLPDEIRQAIEGKHSTTRPGSRPFRVALAKENE